MKVKEYIIIEADSLFSKYGFKSVTMDDIAKQLGISKRTIYQHFSDKDELINVLIDGKLDMYEDELKAYAEEGVNAVQEVFLGIAHIDEWLNTMNAKLFYDLQKYHHAAWLKFKNFKENSLAMGIVENIKRGMQEGVYRRNLNVDVLTQLRLEQGNIIFNALHKYTSTEVWIEITQHFLYGICSLKGKVLIEQYKKQLKTNNYKN